MAEPTPGPTGWRRGAEAVGAARRRQKPLVFMRSGAIRMLTRFSGRSPPGYEYGLPW